jgi:predicted deacylase
LLALVLLSFGGQENPTADPTFDPTVFNRQYSTWAKIQKVIKEYETSYPRLITHTTIGKTVGGRDIIAVRLSSKAEVDTGNPEVCFQSGTHGNETGGMMATMRLLRDLVEGYGKDPRITKMMDTRQVWIIPVLNLDAKVTRDNPPKEKNPQFSSRKNMRTTPAGMFGVDLNRNFGIRWASSPGGSS